MGRHRKVKNGALLDAAQQIVLDRGAAHLTLDAVAKDAGVSKASVLYGYKSKDALVQALVIHSLEAERARIAQSREALGTPANSGILARIALIANHPLSVDDRSVAMAIISAMASDAELKDIGRAFFRETLDDILGTASSPRGALLAFLALEGLRQFDYLDINQWPREEFEAILEDIAWLSSQDPGDTPRARSAGSGKAAGPPSTPS